LSFLVYAEWPNIPASAFPEQSGKFGPEPDGLWFRAVGESEGKMCVLDVFSDRLAFRRYRDRAMANRAVKQHLSRSYGIDGPSFAVRESTTAFYPGAHAEFVRSRWHALPDPGTIAIFAWPSIRVDDYVGVMRKRKGILGCPSHEALLSAVDGPLGDAGWLVAHAWRSEAARLEHVAETREWSAKYIEGGPLWKRTVPLLYVYYGESCPHALLNPLSTDGIA